MTIAITTDTHYCLSTHDCNILMLEQLKLENPHILLHCGDVSNSNWYEQKQYFELVRNILGNILIVTVNGNHDWWCKYYDIDPTKLNIEKIHNCEDILKVLQKEVYGPLDIHHASENLTHYENGKKIYISGFDGWYSDLNVPRRITNDYKKIPQYYINGGNYLNTRSVIGFEKSIEFLNKVDDGIKILMTHFGFTENCTKDWKSRDTGNYFGNNPKFENYIDNVDYLFYGHSHIEDDSISKNNHTKILNTGSDYDNPKYRILEI